MQVERISPPAELLTCPDAPLVPQADTQAQVAGYILDLHRAWADCHGRLGAVRDWVAGE